MYKILDYVKYYKNISFNDLICFNKIKLKFVMFGNNNFNINYIILIRYK